MTDSYLQNRNISNNIILNNPNYNPKYQNQIIKKDMNESYTSSDEDKNETIDNKFNDSSSSLDVIEFPKSREDISNIQQFNKKYNNNLHLKTRNNSEINLNKSNENFFEKDKKNNIIQCHLNRAISGNILPLHKNTNIVLGNININFERIGYKPSTSQERNTLKQAEGRFSSASESKYQFFNRKTVSNGMPGVQNNIYNKNAPSSQKNNILNKTEVGNIDKEPTDNFKKINKKNKDSNKFNLTYNNNYGNLNSYRNLSPTITNPKDNIKKMMNNTLDSSKNESLKNINNQNNNIKKENLNENTKLIINNIKIINSFGNNSPKRNKSNLKQKNISDSLSNFGLSERNNSLDYLVNTKKTFLDEINPNYFKNLDINNQQRLTNGLGNISHINKNQNNIQRLTVPFKPSPNKEKNYQNQNIVKNNLIPNNQNIQINSKIFFNPNLKKVNIKSKSPRLANVKKIPTSNNITNFNTFNHIKEKLTNQINRHCISPNSDLESQNVNNIINKQFNNEQNKMKNIKKINLNDIYNNAPNINKEINSMKTMYKFNISNNIISNFNNMNNLNNINERNDDNNFGQIHNININTLNTNNIKNNNKEKENNSKKINIINKMNTNIFINKKNVLNNISPKKINISRNPNIKNDLQNMNAFNKTIPQNNSSLGQQRNTLTYNYNSKFIPKIKNQNIKEKRSFNFIPERITSIRLENERLTQVPINSQEINNIKFFQKEISSHLSDKNYLTNPNQMYLYNYNEKQFLNKIQNNNLINRNVTNSQTILNELINQKDIDETYNKFDATGLVKNYAILTLPGKDTSGNQKTNQDSFIFKTNINNIKNFNIFGVLDGHGPDGHYVSKFASEFISSLLSNHPEIKPLLDPDKIYKKLKDNNYKIITKTFIETDNQLKKASFDSSESGCTCSLIINIGKHIICANTGDSRAIVVFSENGENNVNFFKGLPLSVDYKPEIPEETKRILMCGGEVRQLKNELGEYIGPYRVWAKNGDYPGLAMSRSIGDLKGKNIGIIPDPGILEYDLSEKTKYIVVCSDGVWEFLENDIVKDIGKKYYIDNNPSGFCQELVSQSLNLWEKNDIVVDDITAVVAFF